jgi:guanylate kinase
MKPLIIVTAPSGAGKTTIVKFLLNNFDNIAFSVSATTRSPRDHETNGKDYYFMSKEEFMSLVEASEFAEWEEVYEGQYYGTLISEMERIWNASQCIIFDIDVKGAQSLRKKFPDALAVFIKPPTEEVLMDRLKNRKTETPESLAKRIAKAKFELSFADSFDNFIVNDELEVATNTAKKMVQDYLAKF